MTRREFRDVDDLLSQWSASHEPAQQHLDHLNDKIEGSFAADQQRNDRTKTDRDGEPVVSRSAFGWETSTKLVLSLAAVVIGVVLAAQWIVPREGPSPVPIASVSPADPIERISAVERQQKQQLLADLDRMFDGKRVWFAETESEVVLGGDVKPSVSDVAEQSTVAMRLVLAKRSSQTRDWTRVWMADVVSRTNQVVQFVSREPQQPVASVTAWTHLLPDGMVACDVALKWDDDESGQLTDSVLISPGETQTGASLSVDGVEYRLFHAIALLDKNTT